MTDFSEVLRLYSDSDRNALQIGWEINALVQDRMAEEAASGEKPPLRTVLTAILDELVGDEQTPGPVAAFHSSIQSARNTNSDRARVCRHFTADRCAELRGKWTFANLRSAYVPGDWPEADAEATERNVAAALAYAEQNGGRWPSATATAKQVDAVDRAKRACRTVIDKGAGSEDFRRICSLVANYEAGDAWAEDATQKEMVLV